MIGGIAPDVRHCDKCKNLTVWKTEKCVKCGLESDRGKEATRLKLDQPVSMTMTPEQRIDAALDKVLKASGSALKHYTAPATLKKMRNAMHDVMSESYIAGSNAEFNLLRKYLH
jgi:hypothetical protein